MTVRLFRSTDAGSPQLSNSANDGSLLTILRACLVDGYGSGGTARTPAGWTLPFSDIPNGIACFKALGGDYLRLNDNLDYRWASVLGFKTMSDKDTGTEQYPNSDQVATDEHYRVYKRPTSSQDFDGWMVIASEDWFYYIGMDGGTTPSEPSGFYFGKYECVNPSFTENYILTGYMTDVSDSTTNYPERSLYSEAENYYGRRNYQNSLRPVRLNLNWEPINYVNPNPFTGSLDLLKPLLRSDSNPYIHYGNLYNMYNVRGSDYMGYMGGETFSTDTKNYAVAAYITVVFAIEYDINVG